MNILLDKAGVHTPYILKTTDNGHPMKPFFVEIQSFLACADKLGRYILGHLRYFQLYGL